jgi:ATP-binding cassette subfamily F protein 3
VLAQAHLLLLDEPTNHLDVESIEALEDALEDYDGTVLLVSHDRELLRNTANRVWALEHEHIADFNGVFEDWEAQRAELQAAAARRTLEEKTAREARERAAARRRKDNSATERATQRALKKALEEAEAEVHSLEQHAAHLRAQLEDTSLYVTPDGIRKASDLARELDDLEEQLVLAIEHWTNSADAAG